MGGGPQLKTPILRTFERDPYICIEEHVYPYMVMTVGHKLKWWVVVFLQV
jgi:hypothetical protein